MKKMAQKAVLAAFIGMFFSGCIGMSPQESKALYEQSSTDKYIASKFSKFYEDGKYYVRSGDNEIHFKVRVVDFGDGVNNSGATSYIRKYVIGHDLFNMYKNIIAERGNIYKVYSGDMNRHFQSIYRNGNLIEYYDLESRIYLWDLLPAIAEFNKNGELVSIMINRVEKGVGLNHFNVGSAPATLSLVVDLLYGVELNPIKYSVSKKDWESNIIQTNE